jgi:hypothetical protein
MINSENHQSDHETLSPEEQAFLDEKYGKQLHIEDARRCRLPASGFTETLDDVYDWASSLVNQLNQLRVAAKPVQAFVWAYREQSFELVALDFDGGIDACLQFLIGEPHNFYASINDGGVIAVPDMTEALHMIGIVLDALDIKEVKIGKRVNEVNPYCTPSQWVPGQTNAPLKIMDQATYGGLVK